MTRAGCDDAGGSGELSILALGSKEKASFTSIRVALAAMGNLHFRHEQSYKSTAEAVNEILLSAYDAVVMPNPYGNPRRLDIYRGLRSSGFPVIIFDRGALPESWFFDLGFNADSPSMDESRWNTPLDPTQRSAIYTRIQTFKNVAPALEAQGPRRGKAWRETLGIQSNVKVLFVPFQRPSDTTVRYFGDPIGSFEQFCTMVEELSQRLRDSGEEWIVVGKKHPLESIRPPCDIPYVDDDVHINDLIEGADALLVINSGVGLLASLWEKPVIVSGTAFYRHDGLNRSASTVDEVLAHLTRLPVVDPDIRDRFIHHLATRIYSFGSFETERVAMKDGSLRTVTRAIRFHELRFPKAPVRPRILFVTSVIPRPVNRGNALRTDQMLQALLRLQVRLDLLVLNQSENASSSDIQDRLRAAYPTAGVRVLRHPKRREPGRWWQAAMAIPYHLRRGIEFLRNRDVVLNSERDCPAVLRRELLYLLNTGRYGTVWFNYLKTMPREDLPANIQIVCDLHDVQGDRIERDVLPRLRPGRRDAALAAVRKNEGALLARLDLGICISPLDEVRLQALYGKGTRLQTLPMTLPVPLGPEDAAPLDQPHDLLFVGSNSDPNVDGLMWFLESCWPRIATIRPETTLLIQGRVIRNARVAKWLASSRHDRILTNDFAEDLAPVYRSAKVVICPIRYGTGMKVKCVEAMAHGKAIVATDVAMAGIEAPAPLVPITNEVAYADEVLRSLRDDSWRKELQKLSTNRFIGSHSEWVAEEILQRSIL